jgi:hypothetical protein
LRGAIVEGAPVGERIKVNIGVMLYSAVDDEVTHYDVDVEAATLTIRVAQLKGAEL